MSINAVQQYVGGLINGVAVPGVANGIRVEIVPKVATPAKNQVLAYVFCESVNVVRNSMPRNTGGVLSTAGFKKHLHEVVIIVDEILLPSNPQIENLFAQTLGIIENIINTAETPLFITDPQTGEQSQILNMGEKYHVQQAPVHTTADKRTMLFSAEIRISLEEEVQQ